MTVGTLNSGLRGMAWGRQDYRSAPQVANLGGHPVQPPFKIPESIIYYFLVASDMRISLNIYVHLNVTKFDRHIFEKMLFLVT